MAAWKLAVFGAPWHPRWVYKNRYFPCVHCMFVDLDRVSIDALDFEPDYDDHPGSRAKSPRSVRPLLRAWPKLPDPLKFRKRRHRSALARRQLAHSRTTWHGIRAFALSACQPVFRRAGRGAWPVQLDLAPTQIVRRSGPQAKGLFQPARLSANMGLRRSSPMPEGGRNSCGAASRSGSMSGATQGSRPMQAATRTVTLREVRHGQSIFPATGGRRLSRPVQAAQCSCSMLIVSAAPHRRASPAPCIGRTQCQELKVLTNTTH